MGFKNFSWKQNTTFYILFQHFSVFQHYKKYLQNTFCEGKHSGSCWRLFKQQLQIWRQISVCVLQLWGLRYFPPLLTTGKSQSTKANFDFEAIKLFPRPKGLLKNPAWLSNQACGVLQSWFCKAAQSPSDCQKERDDSNRIFLLCLLQFMKYPLILTEIKSNNSKYNKGISPIRIKLQKIMSHVSIKSLLFLPGCARESGVLHYSINLLLQNGIDLKLSVLQGSLEITPFPLENCLGVWLLRHILMLQRP